MWIQFEFLSSRIHGYLLWGWHRWLWEQSMCKWWHLSWYGKWLHMHLPARYDFFHCIFKSVLCVYLYACTNLKLCDSGSSKNRKPKFKCPQNQKREGQLCSFCLLVFRATALIKRQAEKAAYPLAWTKTPLWPPLPTSMECGRDSSLPHPVLLVGGTAVRLMRFFSRSAIYIWDRHPPP